ncbi:MAG TPA: phosphoribosylformylglycinamidine synthase subunit PurQ [Phycisphaerales bacterium]|nr:phosphoribosylformylglycinamidine synthase subunit PurQ [Phycisphaerales bacterium]
MLKALVITTAGTNCDAELATAFEMVGAHADVTHVNRLISKPETLDHYDLMGLPGGFSYGDAIAAGRIAAQLMRKHVYRAFVRAIERGVPIIAPCNGLQTAVQMGLLPGPAVGENWPEQPPEQTVSLALNESARFVDRWCAVEIEADSRCVWTAGLSVDAWTGVLPVAHGEGRFVPASDGVREQLKQSGQIAVRYSAKDNPNGSVDDIAGICDASGLVFGLMPHPERFTRWVQHPFWTRMQNQPAHDPLGLAMFRNAVSQALQATS